MGWFEDLFINDVKGSVSGGSSTGGGGGTVVKTQTVIDVLELPTKNIDKSVFYRLLTGTVVQNQQPYNANTICVDGIPSNYKPFIDPNTGACTLYYDTSNNSIKGYIDSNIASGLGVSAGWYNAEFLCQAVGAQFGGIITDMNDDPSDDAVRLLLSYDIFVYADKWISLTYSIGWDGVGENAEVFNYKYNVASGPGSHAEGLSTTASGDSSHAEGRSTTAGGARSHAEGNSTFANGESSHAEGYNTTANGESSHAEGYNTTADGYYSHAEGYHTIARGRYQHVQGLNNVEDNHQEYAHIVGNGNSDMERSNAHTLDWDGNAWFAGYVEGTHMILKSPNGTRFSVTVSDDGTLTATPVQ